MTRTTRHEPLPDDVDAELWRLHQATAEIVTEHYRHLTHSLKALIGNGDITPDGALTHLRDHYRLTAVSEYNVFGAPPMDDDYPTSTWSEYEELSAHHRAFNESHADDPEETP